MSLNLLPDPDKCGAICLLIPAWHPDIKAYSKQILTLMHVKDYMDHLLLRACLSATKTDIIWSSIAILSG